MESTEHQCQTCHFCYSMANVNQTPRCQAVSRGSTGPQATLMKFVSDFFFFWSEIFTRVAYWRSFCSFDGGHLVPPCTKVQILVMMGEAFSTSLSSSPGVTAGLLESPPWYQDCAARHRKPDNGVYWCVILEELDYLFKHSLTKHIQDDFCSWSLSLHIFEEGQTPVYRIL